MFEHETFPNAPIAEAIADFTVAFDTPPTLSDLSKYGEATTKVFSKSRERRAFTTSFEMIEDEPIFRNTEHRFLAFSTDDNKYVAQVRSNGFAFSRLRPYISWHDFSTKTLSAWQ